MALAHIAMHPKNGRAFIIGFSFDLTEKDVGNTWRELTSDWNPWRVQFLTDNILPDGTPFTTGRNLIYGWFEVTAASETLAKELLEELRDSYHQYFFTSTFDPSLPDLDDLRLFMEDCPRDTWLRNPRPQIVCYVQDPEEDLSLRPSYQDSELVD